MMSNNDKYQEIINYKYQKNHNRTHLSNLDRAAQFSPFAALTGHEDAINETARLTDDFIILTNEEKLKINNKLQIINNYINTDEVFTFTYFIYDLYKEGGKYISICDSVKKIDEYENVIILKDNTKIDIDSLYDIDSKLFEEY